jgi:putative DNA primase/helicase
MNDIKTLAVGRWYGILTSLGMDAAYLTGKHGPCPLCNGGKDRWRWDNKDGKGTYYCSSCDKRSGDGFDIVMSMFGCDFKSAVKKVELVVGSVQSVEIRQEKTDAEKIHYIKNILRNCVKVTGDDPVSKYLRARCGVHVPADVRYHPSLNHIEGGKHPVMVSIIRGQDGKGLSLHRTYLTPAGTNAKVDKVKMITEGLPISGGAIRTSLVQPHIGIAEGLETALAAGVRFGLPVWSAINSTMLEKWIPPSGIERVTIFGDNDESWTGQKSAYTLAWRLRRDGYAVDVKIPETVNTDWADV